MTAIPSLLETIYQYYPRIGEKNRNDKEQLRQRMLCGREAAFGAALSEWISKTLADIFRDYTVADWTDENACCFEWKVLLHQHQPLLDDDTALMEALGGTRRDLWVYVSRLAPYYTLRAEETRLSKGGEWQFRGIDVEDTAVRERIQRLRVFLSAHRLTELSEEETKIPVPLVETELRNRGEATVFDCLFTDYV